MNRRTALGVLAAGALNAAPSYRIEKLFKSPEGHPNALESTPEGLWVGEQVSDNAYLLDWTTGKVLKKVATESSNTSGMAFGGGHLWMAANGHATFREPKPTDSLTGYILKVDPETGRTVARYPNPDGGGIHGMIYIDDTIWVTCFKWKALVQMDAKTMRVMARIPVTLGRAHGMAWEPPGLWCMFSNDFRIVKYNVNDGKIMDEIQLDKDKDPDPHGMDMYKSQMYYCDAGISPGPKMNNTASAGWIVRIIR